VHLQNCGFEITLRLLVVLPGIQQKAPEEVHDSSTSQVVENSEVSNEAQSGVSFQANDDSQANTEPQTINDSENQVVLREKKKPPMERQFSTRQKSIILVCFMPE